MLNYTVRVHSLLIPIQDEMLLLPNANVAEIIHYREPEVLKGATDWLLGFIRWRELKIPLVSFEAIIGAKKPEEKERKWIVVLNALGGKPELPFFAMAVKGRPKLIQVDESVVTPMTKKEQAGILRHVHVNGDPAIIPDPDLIEKMIFDFRSKVVAK